MSHYGGQQTFAKQALTAMEASKKYEVLPLDWRFDSSGVFIRGIARYSPSPIGRCVYKVLLGPVLEKRYPLPSESCHFWSVESSLAYPVERYVVTVHGLDILPHSMRGFRRNAYYEKLSKASLIHANSEFTKALILRTFPFIDSAKIRIIFPGVRVRPKTARVECPVVRIGTLTRLVKRKNVLAVIRALNIIAERNLFSFDFHLVGNGPERGAVLACLKHARFRWVYEETISEQVKVEQFFPGIDIFVMPPLESPNDVEGFGIVFIEANAFGVPVVASRTGGVASAVNDGLSGLFANPNSPEDIADKICCIRAELSSYRDGAHEWSKQFDISGMLRSLERFYDDAFS
jgi:phosphatidylinositol alpha-1,6-mannosyltransferase